MADQLVLRRQGAHLVAPSQAWADLLMQLPEGVDLNVKATKARSIKQLGTYWGALDWVIKFGPEWIGKRWLTRDELSDALQIKVGFVKQIASPICRETVFTIPASKNFTECSQQKFNEYFNKVQDALAEWCEYDAVEMYFKWMAERKRGKA